MKTHEREMVRRDIDRCGTVSTMLEVKMLGPLEVRRDGQLVVIPGHLPRSVFGRLLVSAGRPVPADVLLEDVWEGSPPATARKTLQKYISELRRRLGADAVRTSAAGYAVGVPWEAVDAGAFEALVSGGAYAEALALWRGDPLVDLGEPVFLVAERQRLESLRLHALEQTFSEAIDDGRGAVVLPELAVLTGQHPLREGLTRLHMLALYRTGRHVDALRVFELHRKTLTEEIGVEPGAELRELEAAILRHDPTLRRATTEADERPTAGRATLGNLPAAITSFIGREEQVEFTVGLVERNRLITLVGPGGIGKTRLSIEVAERLRPTTPGGVWFVDFAPVADGRLVPDTVAAALDVDVREAGNALAAVTAWLQARPPCILLLDNCEHIAPPCAGMVSVLLRSCPDLTILATSRRSLGVDGEYVNPVPPMPDTDAIALLVDRADRVGVKVDADDPAQMTTVTNICRATDGLPLAIELAASRLRVVSPAELESRLADLLRFQGPGGARQGNLHDIVAWSYDLLDPQVQRTFARLGVFSSPFSLEAAEAVCAAGGEEPNDVLSQIATLVDHSLISREEDAGRSRYRLLETLRLFALEQLDDADEARQAHRAHAEYHLHLASRAGAHLYGPDEVTWKKRLDFEQPNLHSALRWAADSDPDLAFRLAIALWPYWDVRWGERHAVTYLSELLAASADRVPEELLAWGLTVAADLAANPGDGRRSTAWAEQAVAAFRRSGDDFGLAHALVALGSAYANQARLHDAEMALNEAIHLGEQHADPIGLARALNIASFVASRRGDHDTAYRMNQHEFALWDTIGSGRGRAIALRHLAVAQWYRGNLDDAKDLCERALRWWESLDDPTSVAHVQTTLADIARVRGEMTAARDLYEQALTELQAIGDRRCTASTFKNLALIAAAENAPEAALTLLRQALALRHELGDTPGLAECLEGMALAHGPDDPERSAHLLITAAALRRTSGTPPPPWEAPILEQALATAVATLPPSRVDAIETAASTMTPEAILAVHG